MIASAITIDLNLSFDEIHSQIEAAKYQFDKEKIRRNLIQQIRLTCAVAVGNSVSGRDMHDAVLSAATRAVIFLATTAGTMTKPHLVALTYRISRFSNLIAIW